MKDKSLRSQQRFVFKTFYEGQIFEEPTEICPQVI
jgi:hypothetical protein